MYNLEIYALAESRDKLGSVAEALDRIEVSDYSFQSELATTALHVAKCRDEVQALITRLLALREAPHA